MKYSIQIWGGPATGGVFPAIQCGSGSRTDELTLQSFKFAGPRTLRESEVIAGANGPGDRVGQFPDGKGTYSRGARVWGGLPVTVQTGDGRCFRRIGRENTYIQTRWQVILSTAHSNWASSYREEDEVLFNDFETRGQAEAWVKENGCPEAGEQYFYRIS